MLAVMKLISLAISLCLLGSLGAEDISFVRDPPVFAADSHRSAIREYVYVNCGDVQQFRVGNDGGLVPLNPSAAPGGSGSPYVFLSPNRRFAYAPDNDNATVFQYSVMPDGTLEPLTPPSAPTGRDDEEMAFTPNGRAAYVANLLSNTISQFRVGTGGTLEPFSPPDVPGGDILGAPTLPPHRHFAYVPGRGGIAQFAVRPDGSLRPLSPQIIPVQGDAERMVCDPSGRFLYVSGVGLGGIRQFRIRGDGHLAPLSPEVLPLPYPAYFAQGDAPPGYLYALVVGTGIAQLRIGSDGRLVQARPTIPCPTTFLTFAHGGRFAYCADDNGLLRSFKVGADGGLSPVGTPLPISLEAGRPAVVPSGRYVYVPNFDGGTISQFRVLADGSLAPLKTPDVDVNGHPSTLTILRLPRSAPVRPTRKSYLGGSVNPSRV